MNIYDVYIIGRTDYGIKRSMDYSIQASRMSTATRRAVQKFLDTYPRFNKGSLQITTDFMAENIEDFGSLFTTNSEEVNVDE